MAGLPARPGRIRPFLSLATAVLLAQTAPACAEAPAAERFIQGKWSYTGSLGRPGEPGPSWHIEWSFSSGRFRQSGYPPLLSEGRYRVLQATDAGLALLLYEQKGHFSEEDRRIRIAIDRKAGTISIDGGPALKRNASQ
ncbi:MAG: hypothetical protein KIT16_07145 [Rhodospirillaceae bacterium]|nr:hypothetical protein [Rhodospirillaceae bacterium]